MSKELISIIQNNRPETEIVDYLSSKTYKKKDINIWDPMGNTILTLCASRGMIRATEKVLKLKPKMNVTNVHGSSAIHWASIDANYDMLKLLIDHGANYNLDRNSFMLTSEDNKIQAPLTAMLNHHKYGHNSPVWLNKALKCADLFLTLPRDKNQVNKFLRQARDSSEQRGEVYQKILSGLMLLKEKYDLEYKIQKKSSSLEFSRAKKI